MTPSPTQARSDPALNLPELLQHAEWLRGLAHSLVTDGNEAEDVFQESMAVALARVDREGTAKGIGRPWLAGVARMVTRSRRRREVVRARRNAAALGESGRPEETTSPVEDLELLDQQRSLIEHVGALPPAQRRVILARFYDGHSPREIAERTGVGVPTIKSQLHRGLAALRVRLDEEYGDRRSWALALLPLARTADVAALKHGAMAAGAAMKWLKLAAAVLVISSVGIFLQRSGGPRPDAPATVDAGLLPQPLDTDEALAGEDPLHLAGAASGARQRVRKTPLAAGAPAATQAAGARDVISLTSLLPPAAATEVGDLIVRCVQAGTSLPAPDVLVGLRGRDDQPAGSYARGLRSGTDGVARWDGIPAGAYFVMSKEAVVTAGGATEFILELPWASVIRGRVVDWSGQPVSGALVSEQTGARAWTDATGRFELHGAPVTAWVQANADGFQHSDVDVVSTSERTERDVLLTMRRGGASLSGLVLSPTGAAVAGIRVRINEQGRYKDERGLDYNKTTLGCTTDETGRYRFERLHPMPLEISVRSGPFGSFRQGIVIEQDATVALDIVLPEPLVLFGTVTDAGGAAAPGTSIAAYPDLPGVMQVATTDADGRYRFDAAPGDIYQIRATHPQAGRNFFSPDLPASGTHQLDIALPGSVADIIPTLSGRLVDAAGSPLMKWPILATSPEGSAVVAYTDEDGRFTSTQEGRWMKDLSAVSPKIYGRVVQSFLDLATSSTPVALQVTVEMGSIRGSVEDRSGGLPEDAEVQLYLLNGPYARAPVSAASPSFEWSGLPPGEYQVRLQAVGRATRKVPVKLEPGQTLDLGTLVSSVGGSLELNGLPTDRPSWLLVASGRGVVTDAIEMRPWDQPLERLPEGPVTITVITLGYATQSFGATIERGGIVQHTVTSGPGYPHQLIITAGGCPPDQYGSSGVALGYTVEDPNTGRLIAALSEWTDQSSMRVVALAAGTYRVRAFTPAGHRGEALIRVEENDPDGSTPLALSLPGLH